MTAASPPPDRYRRFGRHGWVEALVAGRSAIVVGDASDELVLALRGGRASRLEFASAEELQNDALPEYLGPDFDVVVVVVQDRGDGRELHDAAVLAAPGATIVAVVETADATATTNGNELDGRQLDTLRGTVERLELRRAAVLRELVACERAFARSEEFAQAVHEEILLMRRTVSWRVTRPLRWVRARAGRG